MADCELPMFSAEMLDFVSQLLLLQTETECVTFLATLAKLLSGYRPQAGGRDIGRLVRSGVDRGTC